MPPAAAILIWAAKPLLVILAPEFRVRFAVEAEGAAAVTFRYDAAHSHARRNGRRVSEIRRFVRRAVLHGGADHGHLLHSLVPGAQAAAPKRGVLRDGARGPFF